MLSFHLPPTGPSPPPHIHRDTHLYPFGSPTQGTGFDGCGKQERSMWRKLLWSSRKELTYLRRPVNRSRIHTPHATTTTLFPLLDFILRALPVSQDLRENQTKYCYVSALHRRGPRICQPHHHYYYLIQTRLSAFLCRSTTSLMARGYTKWTWTL